MSLTHYMVFGLFILGGGLGLAAIQDAWAPIIRHMAPGFRARLPALPVRRLSIHLFAFSLGCLLFLWRKIAAPQVTPMLRR